MEGEFETLTLVLHGFPHAQAQTITKTTASVEDPCAFELRELVSRWVVGQMDRLLVHVESTAIKPRASGCGCGCGWVDRL